MLDKADEVVHELDTVTVSGGAELSSWRSTVFPMALHLHRAERTDLLADGLGALLADPQSDPFAEELVVVPARGVERWLSQRLSHILGGAHGGDGVCAGVSFRSLHDPASASTWTVGSTTIDGSAPIERVLVADVRR